MKILITGGAGFIGRHLVKLLAPSHDVVVFDSLEPLVHGPRADKNIPGVSSVVVGRVEEFTALLFAMQACEVVIHLAAGVSVEASYREPARFFRANSLGTAVLWQAIHRTSTVKHVVVASSMSVYGEGFDNRGVTEDDPCRPESLYGWSKYDTEQISLLAGRLYGIPTAALRIWNTYGPGQSLTNAETGVVAIFAARLLTGEAPIIYDNGSQLRDFVHVTDVARAFESVVEKHHTGVLNVGTGSAVSILTVADLLCAVMSAGKKPVMAHSHRPGDVMHCTPNVHRIYAELGWQHTIAWTDGLTEYARNLRR